MSKRSASRHTDDTVEGADAAASRRRGSRVRVGVLVIAVLAVCSTVLALCVTPTSGAGGSSSAVNGPEDLESRLGKVGSEVQQLRTRSSRTYRSDGGALIARVFSSPVHFRNAEGRWATIDNTLERTSAGDLVNRANSYRVTLPDAVASQPVRVRDGDDWVSFRLRGSGSPAPKAAGAEATYDNVLPGVDLEYEADADAVKERLILSGPGAPRKFAFDLDVSSALTPHLGSTGAIELRDADGDQRMAIAPPNMVDANGATSFAVAYDLTEVDGAWRLTLEPTSDWLDDRARAWPVTVDPTVQTQPIDDCTIAESTPDTSLCSDTNLKVGHGPSSDHRALVRFSLGGVVPGDGDVSAAVAGLYLRSATTATARTINAFAATRAWTSGASWDKSDGTTSWTTAGGDFDANRKAEFNPSVAAQGQYHYWNLLALTKAWANGSQPNHGLLLKDDGATTENVLSFASKEYVNGQSGVYWDGRPYLDVRYTRRIGQRRGFKMETQKLSDRIGLSVNAGNGNLLVQQTDFTLPGGLGPDFTLSRSFNSYDHDPRSLGGGWGFDTAQDVNLTRYSNWDALVRLPSGDAAFFDAIDATDYKTPPGYDMTLKRDAGSGYHTLTEHQSQAKWQFDSQGRLIKREDRNGRAINFAYYPSSNRVQTVTDARGKTTTLAYDAQNRVSTVTDPANRVHTYTYESTRDLLMKYTDPAGGETWYEYNNEGLSAVTTPAGRRTEIKYYPWGEPNQFRVKSVTRVTDAAARTGPTTTFSYFLGHDGSGRSEVTDPNSQKTTYHFDADSRVTRVVDGLGRQRTIGYTANSNVNEYTSAASGDAAGAKVTLNYDADGNNSGSSQQTSSATTTDSQLTTSAAFGAAGGVSGVAGSTYLPGFADNEQGQRTSMRYDAGGNPTSITRTDGTTAQATVSEARFEYDPNAPGKLTKTIDPNNNETSYGYDTNGNLTSVTPPAPVGPTTYTYDAGIDSAVSRVSKAHLPDSRSVTYAYDAMDRVTKLTFSDGSTVAYTYDKDGNQTQRVDSVHGTTTTAYDALGRLDREDYPGGKFTDYGYDLASNLLTAQDNGGTTTFEYDALNRQKTVQEPGMTAKLCYSYTDGADRDTVTTTMPNGVVVEDAFDKAGRMLRTCARPSSASTACSSALSSRLQDLSYTYAQGAKQRALVQTKTDEAGKVTSYSYDKLDRLDQATTASGPAYDYDYDAASNITKRVTGGTLTASTTTYAHNAANRLCWLSPGGGSGTCGTPPTGARTFTYDANGNEKSSTGGRTSSTYNVRNQIVGATVNGTAFNFSYAGYGQEEMMSSGGTSFTYGAQGVNSATTGTTTTYYTRDEGNRLVSQRGPTSRQYFLADRLGSVTALVDSAGSVVRRHDYDPYGQMTLDSGASGAPTTRFGFAGGRRDTNLGTYHFGARQYDPSLARWTQADPLQQPADLRQANRYAYVGGDPVNLIDATGLWGVDLGNIDVGETVDDAISGAIGGGAAGFSAGGPKGALIGAARGAGEGAVLSAAKQAGDEDVDTVVKAYEGVSAAKGLRQAGDRVRRRLSE